jgi:hypothetical protein
MTEIERAKRKVARLQGMLRQAEEEQQALEVPVDEEPDPWAAANERFDNIARKVEDLNRRELDREKNGNEQLRELNGHILMDALKELNRRMMGLK